MITILLYIGGGLLGIFLLLVLAVAIANLFGGSKERLTKEEVATHIEHFLARSDTEYEWDDFTSVPIQDPELDQIRGRCLDLLTGPPEVEPGDPWTEESKEEMRQVVADLRRRIAAERKKAAGLARELYERRLNYDMFMQQYPSAVDKDVGELQDLIEHEPESHHPEHHQHMEKIHKLIERLSA